MNRLRALTLALLLATGLVILPSAATATPTEVCNPDPKVGTSLCLTYDLAVTKPGTATPEARTQRPVDLAISFANTSTNHDTDNAKWIRSLTVNLLSGGAGMEPVITGSADLPDGLLIAGASGACGDTGSGDFSACTAGHGTAYADVSALGCAPCPVTFGIQRIYNDKTNLGSHFLQFSVDITACVHSGFGACFPSPQSISQSLVIDKTGGAAPTSFTVVIDKGPADDLTLDSGNILLHSVSNQTKSGPADKTYTWFRLPARCGDVNASATARSTSSAVTVTKSFSITGCAQLSAAWSKTKVVYGGPSAITGSLIDFDTQTPMAGKSISLKACPVGKACTTSSKPTDANGLFAFTVKPARNTTYAVSYAGSGVPDTDTWVPGSSVSKTVRVAPIVTLKSSVLKIKSGGTVKLTGSVKPAHAKKTVVIQRKIAGVWKKIGTATLTAKSFYAKTVVLKGARGSKALLRVVMPAHADHLAGTSKPVTITFL